jgi:hypothetical protein
MKKLYAAFSGYKRVFIDGGRLEVFLPGDLTAQLYFDSDGVNYELWQGENYVTAGAVQNLQLARATIDTFSQTGMYPDKGSGWKY